MKNYTDIEIGDLVYVATDHNERYLPILAHSEFLGQEENILRDCDDYKINANVNHVTTCYFDVLKTQTHGTVLVEHGNIKRVDLAKKGGLV